MVGGLEMEAIEIGRSEFEKILRDVFPLIDDGVFEVSKKTKNYRYVIPFRQLLESNKYQLRNVEPWINYEDCESDLSYGLASLKENLFGEMDKFNRLLVYRSDAPAKKCVSALILRTQESEPVPSFWPSETPLRCHNGEP